MSHTSARSPLTLPRVLWLTLGLAALAPALAPGVETTPSAVLQEDDDPALGMNRVLGIEEAWVENAAYVFAIADNALSPGHEVAVEGEADFAFSRRFGGEVDFPEFLMLQPLGRGASTLGPVAVGLRYVPVSIGTPSSARAGLCSIELEGAIAPRTSAAFPDLANTWTAEALGAFRWGSVSVQGLYGLTRPTGSTGPSGWFANTSLSVHLAGPLITQIEADLNGAFPADDRGEALKAALLPQLGVQVGAWTIELGESVGLSESGGSTVLMVETDL